MFFADVDDGFTTTGKGGSEEEEEEEEKEMSAGAALVGKCIFTDLGFRQIARRSTLEPVPLMNPVDFDTEIMSENLFDLISTFVLVFSF